MGAGAVVIALALSALGAPRALAQVQIVGEEKAYVTESRHPYAPRLLGAARPAVVSTQEIVSPNAAFLRVHFSAFHMAPGDFVVVSDVTGEVAWRYEDRGLNGDGHFWSFAVPGATARVTIHATTGGAAGYRIDKIAHGTQDIFADDPGTVPLGPTPKSICGADNKEDVVCHPDLASSFRPIARLLFATSGGGHALCTGWLLNGSNSNTMITNNHCISNQAGVSSLQVMFNFQHTTCGGSTTAATTSVSGNRFLKTSPVNGGLDYTLFTVNGNPAASFGTLTAAASAPRAGQTIFIMQHPGGQQKQVGFFSDGGRRCTISSNSGTQTSYNCDTAPGSSGSAVIDAASLRVVGIHHFGGCPNSASQMAAVCRDAGSLLRCQ
jgi:V8-like Glu-specific endopeptidase